jgi:hypothetical protein
MDSYHHQRTKRTMSEAFKDADYASAITVYEKDYDFFWIILLIVILLLLVRFA